jgi:hypothetical protein
MSAGVQFLPPVKQLFEDEHETVIHWLVSSFSFIMIVHRPYLPAFRGQIFCG